MESENSFIRLVEESIRNNWNLDALTDYKGATLQYRDVARKIEKMHILLAHAGIQPGDKIALCGRNSANWTASFLGIITYGAVAVPILHEFKSDNVHNIVNHSESRMLFVGDQSWENFNEEFIVSTALVDDIVSNWTITQAQAIFLFLSTGKTQKEIADDLRKSSQAISKLLIGGKVNLIELYLNRYEQLTTTLIQ